MPKCKKRKIEFGTVRRGLQRKHKQSCGGIQKKNKQVTYKNLKNNGNDGQ